MSDLRIITLVPSLTELLIDLGLTENLVGRTRFCIHPKEVVDEIPIIGGTKNPNIDKIKSLNPTLIIANHEENRKEDVELLEEFCEVMVTEISTIDDALFEMDQIGRRCGVHSKAEDLIDEIYTELHNIPDEPPVNVVYLIWRNPWMTVGGDTYINSVLNRWNLNNLFANDERYPKITLGEISQKKPQTILLSSEPFPFKEKHIQEVSKVCPNANVILVDGEWFSWYGSRMLHSFRRLNGFRRILS